jgi:hypothetical protein
MFKLEINTYVPDNDKHMDECDSPVISYYDNQADAETMFRQFLYYKFRPIRLTDPNGDHVMKAEHGMRHSC